MLDEVFYEKPFLKQVVVRIDFVTELPGYEKALPPKLVKILSDHFPIVEPTEVFTHEVQLSFAGSGEVQQRRTPSKIWNFYGKDREKQLTLGNQSVFISCTKYSSYENLKGDFGSVISAIHATFLDSRAARFGLRYINDIDVEGHHPIERWSEYITPVLVAVTPFFDPARLTRLIHVAETKCGDLNLRFQFGLPNPDYPSPIKRPSYVLDFDAYTQTAHELPTSLQYMDQAHQCIQQLFEQSITDKLRERMRAKPIPAIQK